MQRRAIIIRGIVQGVGFRPFVYHLASRHNLTGFVKNASGAVQIEAEGHLPQLELFTSQLTENAPPLARIEELQWQEIAPQGDSDFQILASEDRSHESIFLSPDIAPCDQCLKELLDPNDRRFLYPFLNCVHCGPRLTIIQMAPYDREHTTMNGFPLCPDCEWEYHDPGDRRFHAQPVACPVCGPQLEWLNGESENPLSTAIQALSQGTILAIKGLGGYHLCCDAQQSEVVSRLRRRKHRDEKPFAVMVADLTEAKRHCILSPEEEQLLLSPRRPIVLLRKKPEISIAEEVAPGNAFLGLMLPYAPLHYLLFHQQREKAPLVMTSGNQSDEPIVYRDQEIHRLSAIADATLSHNRPIHIRCDDSVSRIIDGKEMPLRRSRGYAPEPITLPWKLPAPILAVGGQLKNTIALGWDRYAILSHHLGDLDHYEAYRAFTEAVTHYQKLFQIEPEVVAYDLHPDYASTRYAREQWHPLPSVAVQHHHAHLAACMAEHGLNDPCLGVILDGTGLGSDQTIWGGEFLYGDYRHFERLAHLRPVPMPGGDRAIREPWRMALSYLRDAGCDLSLLSGRIPSPQITIVEQMIDRGLNAPLTSSLGRLFDAIASITGLRDCVSFEGQAAIELEQVAEESLDHGCYPFERAPGSSQIIDTRPLIRAVAEDCHCGTSFSIISSRFHATVIEMIVETCLAIVEDRNRSIVLSGGCFMNVLLSTHLTKQLEANGFQVYRHHRVPPNDGGLSLGQLAIAAFTEPSQL